MPVKLFKNINKYEGWETIEISFNKKLDEQYGNLSKPLAVVFCYKSKNNNYCPMIIGMNYEFNSEFHIYRQALFQIIKKAKNNGNQKVYMGMDKVVG